MLSRFIGGILLIVGTSIGAGMLALPIANAATGFWQSSLLLLGCWGLMTLGALFILEVNLYLPPGSNLISMAAITLGPVGILITWLTYLLLLYALLAAYISGGADVLGAIFLWVDMKLPTSLLILLFTVIFGVIVYAGIRQVDLLNRLLMFAKLGAYFLLVMLIYPYTEPVKLAEGEFSQAAGTLMILITSFGFAIILPNLREYFRDDITQLRRLILLGSLIPLACYIMWDAVIMGVIPTTGPDSLHSLLTSPTATSSLSSLLSKKIHSASIISLFQLFTSVCMLTAFLGVSLSLMSFLEDGLKLNKQGKEGALLSALTFLPPVIIVLYYPGAYLHALNYAGFLCVILLLLLPATMSYIGRAQYATNYQVWGGKAMQLIVILSSVSLLGVACYSLIFT